MRCARIKKVVGTGVYHCISRSVAGAFLLDDEAKRIFRKMLWEVADFCGVEVLAYCVMTNHFHILVRVPERSPEVLTRKEVLRRYGVLYEYSNTPGYPDASYLRTIFAGENEPLIEDWMARLTVRMNDVSEFMKTVKQRFTMWFNKRHKRFGTLWSERFKSVLVQDDPQVVRTVAAYIDLNPVRASLVEDPATYAWCSYGEAMSGSECAQNGLVRGLRGGDWAATAESYRKTLLGKVGNRSAGKRSEEGASGGGAATAAPNVQREATVGEVLRQRLPVFIEGKVIGSAAFVETAGRGGGMSAGNEKGGMAAGNSVRGGVQDRASNVVGSVKPTQVGLGEGVSFFAWMRAKKSRN